MFFLVKAVKFNEGNKFFAFLFLMVFCHVALQIIIFSNHEYIYSILLSLIFTCILKEKEMTILKVTALENNIFNTFQDS